VFDISQHFSQPLFVGLQTHFSLRRLLGITDAWMCDRVDIEHNGENYPCITYDWVNTKEVSFAVGKGTFGMICFHWFTVSLIRFFHA